MKRSSGTACSTMGRCAASTTRVASGVLAQCRQVGERRIRPTADFGASLAKCVVATLEGGREYAIRVAPGIVLMVVVFAATMVLVQLR